MKVLKTNIIIALLYSLYNSVLDMRCYHPFSLKSHIDNVCINNCVKMYNVSATRSSAIAKSSDKLNLQALQLNQ